MTSAQVARCSGNRNLQPKSAGINSSPVESGSEISSAKSPEGNVEIEFKQVGRNRSFKTTAESQQTGFAPPVRTVESEVRTVQKEAAAAPARVSARPYEQQPQSAQKTLILENRSRFREYQQPFPVVSPTVV
jgi:hypothetical protein